MHYGRQGKVKSFKTLDKFESESILAVITQSP